MDFYFQHKTLVKNAHDHLELTKNVECSLSEKAETSYEIPNNFSENVLTRVEITSKEADNCSEKADESMHESKSCTEDGSQVILVKSNDQKKNSKEEIESSKPENVVLETKEFSYLYEEKNLISDTVKTLNVFREKTETKNVYPDLKSIQHCEQMEDIESLRILTQTYTEEYLNKTVNGAVESCLEFQKVRNNI
ncbi:hypothetical protein TNCV_300111 [Trichonephila clavipes]|nr:hypothetical protein TNCV_300111 [Trichonephila clavipes]